MYTSIEHPLKANSPRPLTRIVITILLSALFALGAMISPADARVIGDDYPSTYKSKPLDAVVDQWNFYNRECTSFVAWRLNSANGVKFTNQYAGASRWGHAKTWGTVAKARGIKVDSTPAVGAVAWSSRGNYGHVAWVAEVKPGGQIVVEEYNVNWDGKYGKRTVAASSFTGFIHVKDLATTKPLTSTPRPTAKASNSNTSKLTASVATWKPATVTLKYQWQRNGSNISGANSKSYSLTNSDYGKKVRLRVTGSKSGFTSKSTYSKDFFAAKVTSRSGYRYVNIRGSSSASSKLLGTAPSGRMVALECYASGSSVTGPYGKSTRWYRIPGGGWVADALLETNTNSAVTPRC